ncbi:MAG: malate dehydrogenase [Candidatus Marsarchaeota archaeon]|nr:malate dehydrogenase [Candidatus Marsarchaeota archaeon]
MTKPKVSIVGAGRVGATTAQILAYRDICDIVIVNRTQETAEGIALDIMESAPIEGFDAKITGTRDYADITGSAIVIISAGAQRKEGMSREELLSTNASIVNYASSQIHQYAPGAIVIVLTNPLDAMVSLAKRVTEFPKKRIIGMAGILDSSRFASFVAKELNVSVDAVSAMVLGSHGDTMVPLIRYSSVSGIPLGELLAKDKIDSIIQRTKDGGAEIIKLESSSAFYAPASALVAMVESILLDKKNIFPCSAYLEGEYGINDLFIGVPVALGSNGIEKIIELKLNNDEMALFKASANKIRETVKGL